MTDILFSCVLPKERAYSITEYEKKQSPAEFIEILLCRQNVALFSG
jgi:hypothetical protein